MASWGSLSLEDRGRASLSSSLWWFMALCERSPYRLTWTPAKDTCFHGFNGKSRLLRLERIYDYGSILFLLTFCVRRYSTWTGHAIDFILAVAQVGISQKMCISTCVTHRTLAFRCSTIVACSYQWKTHHLLSELNWSFIWIREPPETRSSPFMRGK